MLATLLVLGLFIANAVGYKTYEMSNFCGKRINMVERDAFVFRMKPNSVRNRNCEVTVTAHRSDWSMLINFKEFLIPCDMGTSRLEITDGPSGNNLTDIYCGTEAPKYNFSPSSIVRFRYTVASGPLDGRFEAVISAGYPEKYKRCRTPYEVLCRISPVDYCVSKYIKCDGQNNCGNNKDEGQPCYGLRAGIILASVFSTLVAGLLATTIVLSVVYKRRKIQPIDDSFTQNEEMKEVLQKSGEKVPPAIEATEKAKVVEALNSDKAEPTNTNKPQ